MQLARGLEADPAGGAGDQRHLAVEVIERAAARLMVPHRLIWDAAALLESAVRARIQPRRPEAVLPRARGAGAGALARPRRLRALARQPRGGRGLELLRGPADRQRPARLPPRPRPRLQGRLPALQDDVRLPGAAQGGLGLPRPAGRARGRKAARDRLQAGDRGVRDRRVQPALPRVGLRVRRGVEPADRADRLLDRPRRPLRHPRRRLHRVGLVVAAAALGRRPPLRGPQGRPLLPARRHRRSPRTRWRRATRTSRTPPYTCASRCSTAPARARASRCWSGRRRPGRCPATSPSRSRPRSPTCAPASTARC